MTKALPKKDPKHILVIKHGALGDFVLASGPFAAIRKHHVSDKITLLTTAPYAALAKRSRYFDEVWIDEKPKFYEIKKIKSLLATLKQANFSRVYDLQTSTRSNWYFRLLGKVKPEWSGNIDWCSHPQGEYRHNMHTLDRHKDQLAIAGIHEVLEPDISWLSADLSKVNLPENFVLIVAGGSQHRPEKRWSQKGWVALCEWLIEKKFTPVFIGTKQERWWISDIVTKLSGAINLTDKTSIEDIASLARLAKFAVGNDTGPMHIIAAAKCPSLVLFSGASKPELTAPRGEHVWVLQMEPLENLDAETVNAAVSEVLESLKPA